MAWNAQNLLAESFIFVAIVFCLSVAPYTKVEESFNIQAIHDISVHGLGFPVAEWLKTHYDHFEFPGAVPRTFTGAIALAAIIKPFAFLLDSPTQQFLARAVLGLFNAFCIVKYGRAVRRTFGDDAGTIYLVFQGCQFHVMYYASRTLPNFFAFGLATLALRDLLPGQNDKVGLPSTTRKMQRGLVVLTILGIVFRSEIAALLVVHSVNVLFHRRLSFVQVIQAGLIGVPAGLLLTVPVDSLFWQKLVWPELNAFIFNVIEGKSEEWGTSPFYYYFLISLPKLLFNPATLLICIPVALMTDVSKRTRDIIIPNLAYVSILSIQGHKEWRFIVYVLPPLTAVAAAGADQLWKTRTKPGFLKQLMLATVLLSVPMSMFAGYTFLMISTLNYPGAAALNRFHAFTNSNGTVGRMNVHMDTLTCTTGVTRFQQIAPPGNPSRPAWAAPAIEWQYDKQENPEILLTVDFWLNLDYAIAEGAERSIGAWAPVEQLGTVTGFAGFGLTRSREELQRQLSNVDWAGDSASHLSELGPDLVRWWNRLGLSLLGLTNGKWLTVRLEPQLYVLSHTRGAL